MAVMDIPDNMQDLVNKFDEYNKQYDNYQQHHHHFHKPTIGELDQFKKSWFYDNWNTRFRKLSAFTSLGTKGVVAIPNTTFEEWLYWFQEWAIAWMDDYNEFKNLVYEALLLIEKHLEAIDKTLENHEERIEKLEKLVQQIIEALKKIWEKIQDLQKQINEIKSEIEKIKEMIKDLADSLKANTSPHYMDASPQDVGAQNGWYRNPNAHPNGLNIQYRWVMNNDHSQGMYMCFNFNRIVNDSYHEPNDKLILDVDLTNFVNSTHAQIRSEGWIPTPGSYWNDQQRAGLQYHYTYDNRNHHMKVYIDKLFGLYSAHKDNEKIEMVAISNEFFVPVGG